MTYLPTDKIRVFVSSRMGECKAERTGARQAIESLGHEAVLFEAAGARPYAPRTVYLRGVEESQVFVGIYREGYGYVEDGMKISGLEDEYRYSKSKGIPQLLYVLRDANMDPRLRALVDDFTGPDITVGYFADTSEVADAIRRDLITLISEYFRRGRLHAKSAEIDPGVIADALVSPDRRIRRQKVEVELDRQLERDPVAVITGPLGAGKTVLLSALSKARGWAFVECGEKTPQEVLSDAANAVRALRCEPTEAFLLPSEAQSALRQVWMDRDSVTLVLDDVRNEQALDQIRSVTPVSNSHRLIFSSREGIQIPGTVHEIPPFDLEETQQFVARNRKDPLRAGELVEIHNASKGNPLYLRYFLFGESGDYANDLAEYEAKVWRSLSPSAQEMLSYLAWSVHGLSLNELIQLFTGTMDSTGEVAEQIESANSLLTQSVDGYAIFHPHAKETIRNLTRRSKPRLQFYIQRLCKLFLDGRDYVSAFSALHSAGLPMSQELLDSAGRQAVVKGDFRFAREILEIQVETARGCSQRDREKELTLYLAHVISLSGRADEALELIDDASRIVTDTEPPFDISEVRATIGALGTGDRQAVNALVSKKNEYIDAEKHWDAARISVDLSVYYARQNDPRKSAELAEFAMEVFRKHQDDYGFRIARGNYLSAISGFSEMAAETEHLIKEIEEEDERDPRQRAILCNVLCRRARQRKEFVDARIYAQEAIDIGRRIGDNSIVCNNLMNLGNTYRDEEGWDSAIAQYEAADKLAQESMLVLAEAAAQDLLATVCNRMGDGERAIHHANYAISIARGISSRIELSSMEELARGYELVGRIGDARDTWLRYSELEIEKTNGAKSGSIGFVRAVSLIRSLGDVREYLDAYEKVFDVRSSTSMDLSLGERLIEDLVELFGKVSLSCSFEAAVYHARFLFSGVRKALCRRIYFVVMRKIFRKSAFERDAAKRLRIALAISMAVPKDTLLLGDIVEVGELVARRHKDISFRASWDGAAHWTIQLPLGEPVVLSVVQIDEQPDVSLISLCLILMLMAYSPDIFEDVLAGTPPQRNMGCLHVCSYGEAMEMFPLERIGLVSEPDGCVVTRSTEVATDPRAPILAITSDSLTKDWLPRSGEVGYGQAMFGMVLIELIVHLQAGEIKMESLFPKIAHLVRKTMI